MLHLIKRTEFPLFMVIISKRRDVDISAISILLSKNKVVIYHPYLGVI